MVNLWLFGTLILIFIYQFFYLSSEKLNTFVLIGMYKFKLIQSNIF